MATINSTLQLHDSFSNTLDQIVNALNYTVSAMEEMREQVESPINGEAFKSARAAVDQMNQSMKALESAAQSGVSETQEYNESVKKTENAAKEAAGASKELGDSVKKSGEESQNAAGGFMSTADSISQMLIAAGGYKVLGLVKDGLISAASAAIEFESAITGVYKTVDGSKEQLSKLTDDIKTMTTQIPATTTEIAGVAEAAGQLGIKTQDITSFTRTMIDLGEATNLTSDAAASMLAKFANVTQMDASNYQNLGSVIVDLGNNYATTEADIVNMSTYLASAATLAGFAETDIMALSAAMSSVGIEAEAGGSAMAKLITKMQVAVETGDGLIDFASTADMTAQQFADTFENNAVGALQAFITGLNDVERNGASASVILQQMDLDDIRLSNTIRALASSNDLMSNAVNTANNAWEKNTALTNETNKRYDTLESKLQMTKNSANNLKIAIGDALTPALGGLNDIAKSILDKTAEFAKNNKAVTAGITGFVGTIGTAVGALTTVIPVASQATQAFTSLKNSMAMKISAQQGISVAEAAGQAGSKLLGMAGKLGLVVGGISVAVGLITALTTAFSEGKDEVDDYNGSLDQCKKEIEDTTAQYDAVVRMYGEQSEAARLLSDNLETLNAQYEKGGGFASDYAQRVENTAKSFSDMNATYEEQRKAVESSSTTAQIAAAQLQTLSQKSVKTNDDLNLMGKYADYLNNTFECDIKVNYLTGDLTGFDPNKVTDLIIEQAEQNYKNVAISDYTSAERQQSYMDAYKDVADGKRELALQQQQIEKMLSEMGYNTADLPKYKNTGYTDYSSIMGDRLDNGHGNVTVHALQEYFDISQKYNDNLKNYNEALGTFNDEKGKLESMAIAGGVEDTFDEYISYLDRMAEGADYVADAGDRWQRAIEETGDSEAITRGLQSIAQELGITAEAYDEVYKAAYESFSKQYSLFDDAEKSYKKTVEDLKKDNSDIIQSYIDTTNSQTEYFNKINESITTLSQTSSASIGVSRQEWDEFIDYASQLPTTAGEKGAAIVNAFAEALDSGDYSTIKEAVRSWQDNEKTMQDTSKNIGHEVADVEQAMEKAQKSVETALKNIGDDASTAYNSAKSVVESLASGVNSAYGSLSTQVSAVESLMARLASFSVSINVNKKGKVEEPDNQYATGTLSAAPGLALVGENGPELVNFGGGEVVYTAAQTRRILDSRYSAAQGMQNTAVPEVVVNIPAINIDLGRKNRKYEAVEYYTQNLPPENDSPELSSDDFKRLTTLSERETLSKVYQPNITNKIEMTNNISKDADLDEIVHELSMKLIDVMAVTAEGVHN